LAAGFFAAFFAGFVAADFLAAGFLAGMVDAPVASCVAIDRLRRKGNAMQPRSRGRIGRHSDVLMTSTCAPPCRGSLPGRTTRSQDVIVSVTAGKTEPDIRSEPDRSIHPQDGVRPYSIRIARR
jgi:hypothetical protein